MKTPQEQNLIASEYLHHLAFQLRQSQKILKESPAPKLIQREFINESEREEELRRLGMICL